MIDNMLEHMEKLDNGVIHYDSGLNQFTREEVEDLNRKYYAEEDACIEEILADGFIEFPILWDNGPEPIWSKCYLPPEFVPSCSENFEEKTGLKYNIYIPTYNRAGITGTDKMLDTFGIENYYLCMDPSQYALYKHHHDRKHIIIRDPSFKSDKKLDLSNSVISPDWLHGASGVFNALLYISKSVGEKCYFTMDDDIFKVGIKGIRADCVDKFSEKYNKDWYNRCSNLTPETGFSLKEYLNTLMHFYDKVRNKSFLSNEKYGLVFALPGYNPEKNKENGSERYGRNLSGLKTGTRSYSWYLTANDTAIDHIGQQNNDIITSLYHSQQGRVNIIVEQFVQYNSLDSQSQQGGATGVYKTFGTLDKAKVLVQAQPNYSKVSIVYSRVHHTVDFNSYNKMRLLGAVIEKD